MKTPAPNNSVCVEFPLEALNPVLLSAVLFLLRFLTFFCVFL